jgi:hypothetical protein
MLLFHVKAALISHQDRKSVESQSMRVSDFEPSRPTLHMGTQVAIDNSRAQDREKLGTSLPRLRPAKEMLVCELVGEMTKDV